MKALTALLCLALHSCAVLDYLQTQDRSYGAYYVDESGRKAGVEIHLKPAQLK
jgi:hypothetical protein